MEEHTIAYSKSHRDNGVIQARGRIDDDANTLSCGEGCSNQSTGNYVFTKVEDMTDIKFVGGVNPKKKWKDDGKNLSRNYSQGERVHSPEGLSPCLSANMGGTANGSQLIVEEDEMSKQDYITGGELRTDEGIRTFKGDTVGTLRTKDACGDKVSVEQNETGIRIRKLTPLECERAMSWPDGWTKYGVDEKGKKYELSDSARYKACGNGIVSVIPKALLDHITGDEEGLRIFSTFAGVDGSGMYLKEPKYVKVGFAEYEPKMKTQHAANVLRYHYPNVPNLGDITKIDVKDVPDHDIIFISAPCQSFSSAGRNMGIEDTRGTLFYDTARIMKIKMPKYFIFENVKNLLSKKHERTFEIMCEVYSELGYELDFELINAKHYSTPQNRERVFMIGRLKDGC